MAELREHGPLVSTSVLVYMVSVSDRALRYVTLNQMLIDFDATVGQFATFSAVVGVPVIMGIFSIGHMLRCISPHKVLLIGCISKAIALATSSTMTSFLPFLAILFVCDIVSEPSTQQSVHTVIQASWLSKNTLPSALALINSGYSMAGSLTPLIVGPLTERYGWRPICRVYALIELVTGAVAFYRLRMNVLPLASEVAAKGAAGESAAQCNAELPGLTLREAMRTAQFYLHYLCTFLTIFYEGAIVSQLNVALQREAGLTLTQSAHIYSLQYLFAIMGKLLAGWLVVVLPRKVHFVIGPCTFCASHLLLFDTRSALTTLASGDAFESFAITTSQPQLIAFAICYGSSFGYTHSLMVAQPVLLFGKRALSELSALHWGVNAVGFISGNVVIGGAYDLLGSYGRAFQITLTTTAALAVIAPILGCRREFGEGTHSRVEQGLLL
jgi:sugar phosphate permease